MGMQNFLIRKLLRVITPEEIAEIANKHSEGGQFLLLTDLLSERIFSKVYRDFSSIEALEAIQEEYAAKKKASFEKTKILAFPTPQESIEEESIKQVVNGAQVELKLPASRIHLSPVTPALSEREVKHVHHEIEQEGEESGMGTFLSKERKKFEKSQEAIKQKEVLNLYQKNSSLDVEQVKVNNNSEGTGGAGVLINKKQY